MQNYQVKYAIGSLVKPGMVVYDTVEDLDVLGYFVSKVFFIDEVKKQSKNGHTYSVYRVVFPYPDVRSGKEVLPEYNEKGEVINSVEVFEVFDSKEKAFEYRDSLNNTLVNRKVVTTYENNYMNRNCRKIVEQAHVEALVDVEMCSEYENNLEALDFIYKNMRMR